MWKYNLSTGVWERVTLATSSPGGRAKASIVRTGDDVYLFGGETKTEEGFFYGTNDLWKWSKSANQWQLLYENSNSSSYETMGTPSYTARPGPRAEATLFYSAHHLWLYGGIGYDASGKYGLMNDVWCFDLTKSRWNWLAGAASWSSGMPDTPLPPRTDAIGWPEVTTSTVTWWIYGGIGPDGLEDDMWQIYPSDANFTCTPQTGCTCTGAPLSTVMVCIDGAWVFVTNDPYANISVTNPPPLDAGAVLDLQMHSLTVHGDVSVAGRIETSYDPSMSAHGSVAVADGCPFLAEASSLRLEVSSVTALLNRVPRTLPFLRWSPTLCTNVSSPQFATVEVYSTMACGTVNATQSSGAGVLNLIVSYRPSASCSRPPSDSASSPGTLSPSGGNGVGNQESAFNPLPVVSAVVAVAAVGIVVVGIIIYRRRAKAATDKAVVVAMERFHTDSSGASQGHGREGDAGWWIDGPAPPAGEELGTYANFPISDDVVVVDSLATPKPRPSVQEVVRVVPASPGAIPSPASGIRFVEVAGSEDNSAKDRKPSRKVQRTVKESAVDDAGSESDSASVDADIACSASRSRSRADKTSASSGSATNDSSVTPPAAIEIEESDVEFDTNSAVGAGFFGVVYQGKWRGSRVALKQTTLISSEDATDTSAMQTVLFMSELRAVIEMRPHKSIVRVHGHFIRAADGKHFVVSEFCPRGTLSMLLSSGSLSVRSKIKIVERAAAGLAHLHAHGVLLHRHMRAASVLMDAALRPKLSDYGMLLAEKHSATQDPALLISCARWLAPEVCRTGSFSLASDIYSFGVFISEVLTESKPFAELSDIEAMMQISEHGITPPVPEWCPRYLREVAQVCMNEDPAQRPEVGDVVTLLRMVRRGSIASELESV